MTLQRNVRIYQSTTKDGALSASYISDDTRAKILRQQHYDPYLAVLLRLDYESPNFCNYTVVDESYGGDGIVRQSTFTADALFTSTTQPLMLQLADCVGAVLYDESNSVLGLAHLGRHNLEQHGGTKVIDYMQQTFGSNPESITVFLGAAAGGGNYPLYDFGNRSLHDVATEQLILAGVLAKNIIRDERDTTLNESFFSHSQFLKGTQGNDGRHAIVASLM